MDLHFLTLDDPRWPEALQDLRHDIYQMPAYVGIEAQRTQTVPGAVWVTEGDRHLLMPYLLRPCPPMPNAGSGLDSPELFDAISPYGYPGLLLSEAAAQTPGFPDAALAAVKQGLQQRRVCSLFLRLHPILNQNLPQMFAPDTFTPNGQTVGIDLSLTESELWNHTRKDQRNKINRCRRSRLTARMVPVRDYLEVFVDIYLETMARVEATSGYLEFNQNYVAQLYEALGDRLHICIVEQKEEEGEGRVISAGLYSECGGIVQALFGGTRTDSLKLSPTSLETDHVRLWAKVQGHQVVHLGGGLGGSQDRLYTFKSGFSKLSYPFMTLRLIVDGDRYRNLVTQRAKALQVDPEVLWQSNFFPAYRAPISNTIVPLEKS